MIRFSDKLQADFSNLYSLCRGISGATHKQCITRIVLRDKQAERPVLSEQTLEVIGQGCCSCRKQSLAQ